MSEWFIPEDVKADISFQINVWVIDLLVNIACIGDAMGKISILVSPVLQLNSTAIPTYSKINTCTHMYMHPHV